MWCHSITRVNQSAFLKWIVFGSNMLHLFVHSAVLECFFDMIMNHVWKSNVLSRQRCSCVIIAE